MTNKYSVDVFFIDEWRTIAMFDSDCDLDNVIAFANAQFNLGNSLTTPAENIAVIDLTTGEILWDWIDDQDEVDWQALLESGAHIVNGEPMYPIDIECGFNPYMGGYDYDC